ncbi:MAG: septal ring lytic transglycosylase RlpA family protein [gamma proteobacterium symbiont of Bathyaustriella thionipta]|nr:septal ring lytic transglycosylase RlpA family protein [gamma proteobacterium symbiont of Bathyaustriella thionipta]
MRQRLKLAAFALTALLLSACAGKPPAPTESESPSPYAIKQDHGPLDPVDVSSVADAIPQRAARSRYGNPAEYTVLHKTYKVMDSAEGHVERGIASWYGLKFHGHRTSSGEPYDMYSMTAAHKTLPLPSWARITNLENGHTVVVKINDRGPFHENRIVDLSYAAAARLGILKKGTGVVELRVVTAEGGSPPLPDPATPAIKGTLFLQAGAFSSLQNAQRLQSQLQAETREPVRIEKTMTLATPLYKVQLGPYRSVAQTDHASQQLRAAGIQQSQLIVE